MTSLHGLVAIPSTDSCRAELMILDPERFALVNAIEELLEGGRGRELDQARAA